MGFTLAFFHKFFWGMYLALPPLFVLCVIIIVLGLIVGRIEEWNRFNSLYWTFITALTVGYGDIHPAKKTSKILALMISIVGIMLFGIIIAITVNTFTLAFNEYVEFP